MVSMMQPSARKLEGAVSEIITAMFGCDAVNVNTHMDLLGDLS